MGARPPSRKTPRLKRQSPRSAGAVQCRGSVSRDLQPSHLSRWRSLSDAESAVLEDLHGVAQQLGALGLRTLERVAAHDASVTAALGNLAQLFEHFVGSLGNATREDDDPLVVERA